jgi:hypothetical protein
MARSAWPAENHEHGAKRLARWMMKWVSLLAAQIEQPVKVEETPC